MRDEVKIPVKTKGMRTSPNIILTLGQNAKSDSPRNSCRVCVIFFFDGFNLRQHCKVYTDIRTLVHNAQSSSEVHPSKY